MFGIEDYHPEFISSTIELIKSKEEQLKKLKGKKIIDTWVVWESNENVWFNNCPVLLNAEDIQIVLCANKGDEFSITFEHIEVERKVDFYDADLFNLLWRVDTLPELLKIKGKTIEGIEIIEYMFESTLTYSKEKSNLVGQKTAEYILTGIGFILDDGYFSVTNGLDENLISIIPEDNKMYRKYRLF